MSYVSTQTGQLFFLQAIVNSDILMLHLFSNDRTPSKTDVVTNYTEVVFHGYAPKLLTPSEWIFQIDNLTGNYIASFPEQTFSFDDLVNVFGYYISDHAGIKLLLAEAFINGPVNLQQGIGGNIKITPTLAAK